MTFSYRDASIFCPYPDEVPWQWLDSRRAGADLDRDFIRVAKLGNEVIGAYAIVRESPLEFSLVMLHVVPQYRGAGLGRWLLAHALGLAESKGGRSMGTGCDAPLLRRVGFRSSERRGHAPGELRIDFTPE